MLKIGHQNIHFAQLPSTNAYASELLTKGRPTEGIVITTDNQYSGKGQLNNVWESQPNKNISLSTILYPSWLKVEDQWSLSEAISLAVFHTIDAIVPGRTKIKWPNDIYIGDGKVVGILIQNQVQKARISTSIIGIGINVNQEVFQSDAPNPTSLILQTGVVQELEWIKKLLCENLSQQYHALRHNATNEIHKQYHEQIYRRDEKHSFRLPGGQLIIGSIIGVSSQGLLRIRVGNEELQFGMKEIQFVL